MPLHRKAGASAGRLSLLLSLFGLVTLCAPGLAQAGVWVGRAPPVRVGPAPYIRPVVVYPRPPIWIGVAPPPPPRTVVVVTAPRPGLVWIAPYWRWTGQDYVWVEGEWVPERVGYAYTPAHWTQTPSGWVFEAGIWTPIR